MTPSDSFDPNSLPPFDCLCELCDCGCFEQSRQAHSISCKRFFNQSYEQRRQPKSPADTSCLSSAMSQRAAPRQGQLSEYQYQYLQNAHNVSKESRTKMRDNIDIFSHNGKASDFRSPSSGFEPQMRSKVLDRLNRLMPNNPNVSWYKAENNFFGHDDVYKKNSGDAVTGPTLPGDRQKQDYLKNFEEYNRGFVDSYSEKRGAELVSTSRQGGEMERNLSSGSGIFKSNSGSVHSLREHDFRSPWIPKKYSGRNMFVSHIDSALFPDKLCKDVDVTTHYNHFYVPNKEKKQALLTERPTYPRLDKSVRYTVTNDNRIISQVITLPRRTDLYEEQFHEKPKAAHVQTEPSYSTYQGDFEKPKIETKKAPLCRAAAMQSLMRRDKFVSEKFDKNKQHNLDSLNKRQQEINTILMNS